MVVKGILGSDTKKREALPGLCTISSPAHSYIKKFVTLIHVE